MAEKRGIWGTTGGSQKSLNFLGHIGLIGLLVCSLLSFSLAVQTKEKKYKTENVFLLSMDGVRYTETFGDPEHKLIPHIWNDLRPLGTIYTKFYNRGITVTRQGHSTLITGTWQKCPNGGARMTMPSVFEFYREQKKVPQEKTWAIFGKARYAFEEYSSFPLFRDKFKPSYITGIGENSKEDDIKVFEKICEVMDRDHPSLIFANFGYTDHSGHGGIFEEYCASVLNQDELFFKLWNKIQSDPVYKDKTTLIITNDHGRHSPGVKTEFKDHGDDCEGCQHIMLIILGPDTKKNTVIEREALQIDIAPTIGESLGVQTPLAIGEVLKDSFVNYLGLNKKQAVTDLDKQAVQAYKLACRDLVKTVANWVLKNRPPEKVALNADAMWLMNGMLVAYDKTNDQKYLQYIKSWADVNLKTTSQNAIQQAALGSVLVGLSGRAKVPEYRTAAKKLGDTLLETRSKESVGELLVVAPFLCKLSNATKDARYGTEGANRLIAYCKKLREVRELRRPEADAQLLAALSEAAFFCPDNTDLLKEAYIQLFIVLRQQPEIGGLWSENTISALNLSSIQRFTGRALLKEFTEPRGPQWQPPKIIADLTEEDLARIIGRRAEKPRLPQIKRNMVGEIVRKAKQQGARFAIDLLRYFVEKDGEFQCANTNMGTGALLMVMSKEWLVPVDRGGGFPPIAPALRGKTK